MNQVWTILKIHDVTKEHIEELQKIIDIQADTGNWDYDPYMFGMLNGLLLAKSLLDGNDPDYYEAPKVWLKDKDKTITTTDG